MRKQHILYIVAIAFILNLVFIENNTYSLSYESSVGIGFTFNPTLSINLSSSDLIIPNLTPGSSSDSNSISVGVATNASYGYTLSANVGDNTHNNSNLTHSNNINTFSSIAINAGLPSLDDSEDNNIWGYSTSLDNGNSWSNYNGLSSSTNTTLIDNNNTADSTGSIDFKIGAKAGSTQASGIYTNTINFIAVSKVAPMSLLDSFIASGAEQYNGYFKMQDMTHDICNNVDIEESELQLIDIRDNKIYWVAKLKDGNCWMTQNLDLDIATGSTALNSNNTGLSTDESVYTDPNTIYALKGEGDTYGYTYENGLATWIPERSTYTSVSAPGSQNWTGDDYRPYSWNIIDSNGDLIYPDSTVTEAVAGEHAQSGNYYNWSAAVASNDSLNASGNQKNSICPKGWRLPINGEYSTLYNFYKTANHNSNAFGLMASPLWFVRPGYVNRNGRLDDSDNVGGYWSSTTVTENFSYNLYFVNTSVAPANRWSNRYFGFSVRCMVNNSQ